MARGQYVWIAEADDLCAPDFHWRQCWAMSGQKPALFMRFPQIIDRDGNISAIDYRQNYLTYASSERWVKAMMWPAARKFFRPGHSLRRAPNISAAVFRRDAASMAIGEAQNTDAPGIGLFYLCLAMQGRISYCHEGSCLSQAPFGQRGGKGTRLKKAKR